jgi:hypothetical protein
MTRTRWFLATGLLLVVMFIGTSLTVQGSKISFYSRWPCHLSRPPHLLCSHTGGPYPFVLVGHVYVHREGTSSGSEDTLIAVYCPDQEEECTHCREIYTTHRVLQCCNNTEWSDIGEKCGRDITPAFGVGLLLLIISIPGMTITIPRLCSPVTQEEKILESIVEGMTTEYE